MEAPQKVAVAGAPGRVGRHIVDVLTERGHEVVPISRGHGVDASATARGRGRRPRGAHWLMLLFVKG